MVIIKRNGLVVEFDKSKIVNAVCKAMVEVMEHADYEVCNNIADIVEREVSLGEALLVEDIQDVVEMELMQTYPKVAKAYILYRNKRNELRNKTWEMSELQKDIYDNKYRHKKEDFETFINRVSGYNSDVAKLIRNQDFMFAGRILAGRGLDRNMTLSNCYVLPQPDDNIESIFNTARDMARTYSYGGGVGTDLSLLRPTGYKVNNSALTTSGPVSFMNLYDTTTAVIGQRGRRGALMLSMSTEHPDINDFIKSKANIDDINHANISVRSNGDLFKLDTPEKQETLRLIAENNWATGEPGMLYWDRVEEHHLLQNHPEYKMTSTNPCGEQPLPAYGNCLLGSVNLSNFVIKPFTDEADIDYERLKYVIRTAIIGLNEVLDEGIPKHPLKQQRDQARNFRQIGLGIMGLADMFIKLGIKYGSEESIKLSEELGQMFLYYAIDESVEMARIDGPYPKFDKDIIRTSDLFKSLPVELQRKIEKYGMRNSHVLSIAPTGSISTMIGVSGGIEPIFANSFTRTTKSLAEEGDVKYKVYTEVIEELMEKLGIEKESDLPEYCITSHEINPIDRVKLQGTWQEYIDSAISSTINLNEDSTVEDIVNIYIQGYNYGLKGVTVFRNNSLRMGILNVDEDEEDCST